MNAWSTILVRVALALLVVVAGALADTGASPASRAAKAPWLMGYYVGYQRDLLPIDEIPWSSMTHIAVGAAIPRSSGSLNLDFYLGPGEGRPFAAAVAREAREHGVEPILMLGGAGTHDQFAAAASKKHRRRFVRNIARAVNDLGFAGVDLDWEPVLPADEKPFRALVARLRAALPDKTITVPAGWTSLTFGDVPDIYAQIAPMVDQINLMTYGMEGPWDGWRSWHSSALDGARPNTPTSVATTVGDYLAAGVPAGKLGVGIGFFGDCWSAPVTGPSQNFGGGNLVASDPVMSYAAIMEDYHDPSAARYDEAAEAPYLTFPTPTGPQGCTYVSYEDERSIRAKGAWASEHGLGGAIVWNINQGRYADDDALLRAAAEAFGI